MSRVLRRFRRNEAGSVTVEAVIWFPLFVLFLMMLMDAAMIFMNSSVFFGISPVGGSVQCAGLRTADRAQGRVAG